MDSSPTPQPAGGTSPSQWEQEGRNEKAARVSLEQLDLLSEAFQCPPEVCEEIARTVKVVFASDQLPEYDRCIAELKKGIAERKKQIEALRSKHRRVSHLTADLAQAKRELEDFTATREEWAAFTWAYLSEIQGITAVVIGIEAESAPEDEYRTNLTAELGHAVCDLYRGKGAPLDGGVFEFYDVAAQVACLTSPALDAGDSLAEKCQGLILNLHIARLYSDYMGRCGSFDGAVALMAREDICGKISDEEFAARCADAGFMGNYEKRCSYVAELLSLYARDKPEHVAGKRIAHDLRTEAAKQSGLRLEESLPLLVLIAGKALYDPDVDVSSEEGFLRTVKERLPDYLA